MKIVSKIFGACGPAVAAIGNFGITFGKLNVFGISCSGNYGSRKKYRSVFNL
jgi:hypothetical protein